MIKRFTPISVGLAVILAGLVLIQYINRLEKKGDRSIPVPGEQFTDTSSTIPQLGSAQTDTEEPNLRGEALKGSDLPPEEQEPPLRVITPEDPQGSERAPESFQARYHFKDGDSIDELAKRFYTTPEAILKENPDLDGRVPKEGDNIIIPMGDFMVRIQDQLSTPTDSNLEGILRDSTTLAQHWTQYGRESFTVDDRIQEVIQTTEKMIHKSVYDPKVETPETLQKARKVLRDCGAIPRKLYRTEDGKGLMIEGIPGGWTPEYDKIPPEREVGFGRSNKGK